MIDDETLCALRECIRITKELGEAHADKEMVKIAEKAEEGLDS